MTKLFNKFLTVSVAAFSALSLSACSDKIAGTAEEPNQIANGEKSSSSSEGETANGVIPDSSNSNTSPAPSVDVSSSSRYDEGFTPIYIDPSSSSNTAGEGNKGNDPDVVGNPDTVPAYTAVSRTQDGCPLYILNINDTSPAVHVLTKISKDTIAITEVHDNCNYEPRPFDMHVGFLFEYCGELSESPEIELTFLVKETWNCRNIDYDEYIKKNL